MCGASFFVYVDGVGKVAVDMSMSLDGFIAGSNDRPGQELGEGGMQLAIAS